MRFFSNSDGIVVGTCPMLLRVMADRYMRLQDRASKRMI
jgi:hypothetical protein